MCSTQKLNCAAGITIMKKTPQSIFLISPEGESCKPGHRSLLPPLDSPSILTGSPQLEHVLPQPPAPPPAPPGRRWSYLGAPGREAGDGGRRRRPWRSAADAWRRRRPECGSRRARSLPRRRRSPVGLGLGGGGSAASPAQGGVGGGFRRGRLRSVPCTPRCLRCCCLFTFPEKGPARREGAEPSRAEGERRARGGAVPGRAGSAAVPPAAGAGESERGVPVGVGGLAPIVALSGLRPWHSLARTRSRSQPSALLPPPPARGPPPTAHRSRRRDAPPQWRPEPPWPPGPPGKGRPLPRQRGSPRLSAALGRASGGARRLSSETRSC
ncbi:collagen alpha-1(I) chain-like [Prinia subflava]|uniref:collagen alpha-1(I) chain-like n=1 Tax=Prinia subflava TaxID=208062 RepID=UPI002FE158DB